MLDDGDPTARERNVPINVPGGAAASLTCRRALNDRSSNGGGIRGARDL